MNICARHPGVAGVVLRKIPLMAMPVKQDQPAAASAKTHLGEAYYKMGVMRDLFGINHLSAVFSLPFVYSCFVPGSTFSPALTNRIFPERILSVAFCPTRAGRFQLFCFVAGRMSFAVPENLALLVRQKAHQGVA